jgi:ATP-dependent Clp protease ATP-binding subunit ClpA
MNVFSNGQLNPAAFDTGLCFSTKNWNEVLTAATRTQSAKIESTHFLMTLAKVTGGVLAKGLAKHGMTPEQWENGLASRATRSPNCLPLVALAENAMDATSLSMLHQAEELCRRANRNQVSEPILLLAGLRNVTPAVREKFADVEIDLDAWCMALEETIFPRLPLQVFENAAPGKVRAEAFSPGGKKVLRRLCDEAESMGYSKADARHLLLSLIAHEGGATQYGLHFQRISPTRLQEGVVLSLRSRAKRQRSSLPLDREHL